MNRSIVYIKKIDYLLGPLLLKIAAALKKRKIPEKSSSKLNSDSIRSILIVRPGGIGDAALLLPSIKILKKLNPSITIDVLCEKRNQGIFYNSPFVSRLLDYREIKAIAALFKTRYDLIVDTEQSHFLTSVLISLMKSGLKVGFDTVGRGSTYQIAVPYSHEEYEVTSFFNLFSSAISDWPTSFEWDFPYVFPNDKERRKVAELVSGYKNLVCLFPGASISQRRWPSTKWAQVASFLHKNGFQPLLIGAGAEDHICRDISRKAKHCTLNLCGFLSLTETAALFEKSKLLISTDSGILHLAVICNTPTVSLFGPGIAAKWAPRGNVHVVINKSFTCSPCTKFGETPPCPINARCIKQIEVAEVEKAVLKLLNQ